MGTIEHAVLSPTKKGNTFMSAQLAEQIRSAYSSAFGGSIERFEIGPLQFPVPGVALRILLDAGIEVVLPFSPDDARRVASELIVHADNASAAHADA
jgi:hypothetical protein